MNFRLQDVSQDVSKKSLKSGGKTLTQMLLKQPETQAILTKTMTSKFIQGMVKGTVTNEQYRAFLMQDAHYLSHGRDILRDTGKRITEIYPEFADMYNIQAGKYDAAYHDVLKELNLPDVNDVMLSPATVEYEQFLTQLSKKDPRDLAIGFLPCSQSFRFISNKLLNAAQDSAYKEWFESNWRPLGYESVLEKFINSKVDEGLFTLDDKPLYLEVMEKEKNFIKTAVPDL